MNTPVENRPIRKTPDGWTIISSADNGVEIIEHRVGVENFAQAVDIASNISPLVMKYEPLDSEYTVRVNLSRWMVEVHMSVPTGFWESDAQKKSAERIVETTARDSTIT